MSTPNSLTEVSNILDFGLWGAVKSDVVARLCEFIAVAEEIYVPSNLAVAQRDFSWLGLSDCAWLCAWNDDTHLLTVDVHLYQAALRLGQHATYFNHLREQYGTI